MKNSCIEIISADIKFPSPFSHRVLMLCHEKNIDYQLTLIDPYAKPNWFLAMAPLGQVPIMRFDNLIIPDSRAICEYLDSLAAPYLLPQEPLIRAIHHGWLAFADEIAQEITQIIKQGKAAIRDFKRLHQLLTILNDNIIANYFFGESVSLVDFALISHLLWLNALENHVLPFSIIQKFAKVNTWFNNMLMEPAVHKTTGKNFQENFIKLLQNRNLLAPFN